MYQKRYASLSSRTLFFLAVLGLHYGVWALQLWLEACGILVPWPGIKPVSPALKDRFFLCSNSAGSSLLRVGFSLLSSCRASTSHCSGFSCCGAQALRHSSLAVAAHGLSSCVSWALEHSLSSWGTRAWLLCGIWDLPRSGIEPMSPTWQADS